MILRFLFFFIFLISSQIVFALEPNIQSIKGIAEITLQQKNRIVRFDQAVLANANQLHFEAVDDFGGTPFSIEINANRPLHIKTKNISRALDSKHFSRLIKIPITGAELINLILIAENNLPGWTIQKNEFGQIIGMQKNSHCKRKRVTAIFEDYKMTQEKEYPLHLIISSKKTTLEMLWKNIDVK